MARWSSNKFSPEAKERIVLRLLTKAAEKGAQCPSNEDLRKAVDARSWASVSRIVSMLEDKGIISVKRTTQSRQVTILATGQSTKSVRGTLSSAGIVRTRSAGGIPLDEAAIIAARENAYSARRDYENFWLRKEAEKYGTPKARPISEMVA